MLIEFSVENFRSFRERVTLSLVAAKLRARDERLDHDNVIEVDDKLALLRSAVIYGANASGKSNLIEAATFMRSLVLNSTRLQDEDKIPVESFRLDTTGAESPSIFEIVFLMDKRQYRYGFSVTPERVVAEWLYDIPTVRESRLLVRTGEEIDSAPRLHAANVLKSLNVRNKLFISVVAHFAKNSVATRIREWFFEAFLPLVTIEDAGYLPYTVECIEEGRYRGQLEEFVRQMDTDVTSLSVKVGPLPPKLSRLEDVLTAFEKETNESGKGQFSILGISDNKVTKELRTVHSIRNDKGLAIREEEFSADEMESEGTKKLIALAGPILDVLTNGWVLFLDEIDSRLHPLITAAIIKLFNSPVTNPKNAQLVCTTHDTNLLDRRLFRRDQIYFVEKDRRAMSRLYSLADFKLEGPNGTTRSVRNDATYEKDYIQGRYGAIPYLGDLNRLFSEELCGQALAGVTESTDGAEQ